MLHYSGNSLHNSHIYKLPPSSFWSYIWRIIHLKAKQAKMGKKKIMMTLLMLHSLQNNMNKGSFMLLLFLFFTGKSITTYSQCADSLGWTGTPVILLNDFTNPGKWNPNFNHNTGDTCYVTKDNSDASAICLHWKFNTGNTGKYAQMYYVFNNPVALSDKDIFGFDIKGQQINDNCQHVLNIKIKFENSTGDSNAVFDEWHNLARIDRWCENISVLKNQLKISKAINWNRVKVVSLEVFSNSVNINLLK